MWKYFLIYLFAFQSIAQDIDQKILVLQVTGPITYGTEKKPLKQGLELTGYPDLQFSTLKDYALLWYNGREHYVDAEKKKKEKRTLMASLKSFFNPEKEIGPTRGDGLTPNVLIFDGASPFHQSKTRLKRKVDTTSYYFLDFNDGTGSRQVKLNPDKMGFINLSDYIPINQKGLYYVVIGIYEGQEKKAHYLTDSTYYIKQLNEIKKELALLRNFYELNGLTPVEINAQLQRHLIETYNTVLKLDSFEPF